MSSEFASELKRLDAVLEELLFAGADLESHSREVGVLQQWLQHFVSPERSHHIQLCMTSL